MAKEKKDKKPIYKRWWFWLIIVVIGIGALGSGDEKPTSGGTAEKKEEVKEEKTEAKETKSEDATEAKKKKESQELSDKTDDLYAMLEEPDMKTNIRVASRYFIEEYEKQKVKKVDISSAAVYSNNPVKDKAGKEFLYSFLVQGRYEEKGTGKMADYIMTIAYENDEKLDKGLAACIQYINQDTDTLINQMSEEDDVILKLMESSN